VSYNFYIFFINISLYCQWV